MIKTYVGVSFISHASCVEKWSKRRWGKKFTSGGPEKPNINFLEITIILVVLEKKLIFSLNQKYVTDCLQIEAELWNGPNK